MTEKTPRQLISYIAPSAPATRRPARGDEPFMRPEIGFTPKWYRDALDIDFDEPWHKDPAYRLSAMIRMGRELKRRFGSIPIGGVENPDEPADLITGTFGTSFVAAIYGVPIQYHPENWPWSKHQFLSDEQLNRLEPPDLDSNPFFTAFLEQVEWIARETGRTEGFINWQGVLNNAYRLRGEHLLVDMLQEPTRTRHLFECVAMTMIAGARRLYEVQHQTGVHIQHFTVSNCLVNLVSPELYRDLLLPFDRCIAETFGLIGVHNCAWNADHYVEHYATIPHLGYVDMGMESDLPRAKQVFPHARRAIMYTPMDVADKRSAEIRSDLEQIAREYGPCDMVFADIEAGTPDERVLELVKLCEEISQKSEFTS
ncbi:MAG: hypothetical protein ACE5JP_03865 [Candidatus Bipolaricaulia bacterium]